MINGVAVACIGPVTARTAEEYGMKIDIMPKEYTIPALVEAMVEFLRKRVSIRLTLLNPSPRGGKNSLAPSRERVGVRGKRRTDDYLI